MRDVTYSMSTSADGYIAGPDGDFAWGGPSPEAFQHWTDEIRRVGTHLLGQRLHETMLYWDGRDDDPALSEAERDWARLWNALPKVVFSRTLTEVQGSHARLATDGLAEEVARLRAEPGEGEIAIGGAGLAADAAALDLVDEYRAMVHPVLVGGGTPFFAQAGRQVRLRLVETRPFPDGVVLHRYRVER
ncbi:dihydrofolate reductase family protein [Cellulosimicrobium marinum]|uniref:dihydrofolate reductase family protein n=1 Tax=Cellulosimicrobium marinum TaxID=1638992 RepID=UPI001E62C524|nr:dihydrofolate reductase family protein [Cellulosimicrobium marinum]MCB7137453.1 dihydrofolate reductase family protein [Cellulosimicrobium marinum]